MFYLNRVFIQYLISYTGDIEIIYCLKNGLVDPQMYAQLILSGSAKSESAHYILTRMKTTFVLLEILSKFIQQSTHQNSFAVFLTEIVLNQLAEEYTFVGCLVSGLLQDFSQISAKRHDKEFITSFLLLCERFIWNNKKVKEVSDLYKNFIVAHILSFPPVVVIFYEDSKLLNELFIEFSTELSRIKLDTEKVPASVRRSETLDSFAKISNFQSRLDNNTPLFGQKKLLKGLEVQISSESDEFKLNNTQEARIIANFI